MQNNNRKDGPGNKRQIEGLPSFAATWPAWIRDKKTDPTDCEWIQRLHRCGLLRGSFPPREGAKEPGPVHRAVSDIDGVTGMAMLRAIADGERRQGWGSWRKLRDARFRRTEKETAKQLSRHWCEDHLFSSRQALKMYDAIQQGIADYEREILRTWRRCNARSLGNNLRRR